MLRIKNVYELDKSIVTLKSILQFSFNKEILLKLEIFIKFEKCVENLKKTSLDYCTGRIDRRSGDPSVHFSVFYRSADQSS